MKKSIILTYWFYFFGTILLFIAFFVGLLMPLYSLILWPKDQTIAKIIAIIWGLSTIVFAFIFLGKSMLQWVVIDKEKIISRCLWKVFKIVPFTQIKEIYIEHYFVSTPGAFSSRWIVIDDGMNYEEERNGVMNEKSRIKIPYSQRRLKKVQRYYKGEINTIKTELK